MNLEIIFSFIVVLYSTSGFIALLIAQSFGMISHARSNKNSSPTKKISHLILTILSHIEKSDWLM